MISFQMTGHISDDNLKLAGKPNIPVSLDTLGPLGKTHLGGLIPVL